MKKLNQNGVAHLFLALVIVATIAGFGAYKFMVSKADTFANEEEIADIAALPTNEQEVAETDAAVAQDEVRAPEQLRVKVGTYNILGAGSLPTRNFNHDHHTNSDERTRGAAEIISNLNLDVIGLQEVDAVDNQFGKLKSHLKDRGYGIFPTEVKGDDRQWLRPIVYKLDKYQVIQSGKIMYPYQDAPFLQANDAGSWVKLKSASGSFYVYNVHLIAYNTSSCRWNCNPPGERGGSDKGGAEKRRRAANLIADRIKEVKGNAPVILVGDMNSYFTKRTGSNGWKDSAVDLEDIPYRVFTANYGGEQLLVNAHDSARKQNRSTDRNDSNGSGIDHIYASQDLTVVPRSGPYALSSQLTKKHPITYQSSSP